MSSRVTRGEIKTKRYNIKMKRSRKRKSLFGKISYKNEGNSKKTVSLNTFQIKRAQKLKFESKKFDRNYSEILKDAA